MPVDTDQYGGLQGALSPLELRQMPDDSNHAREMTSNAEHEISQVERARLQDLDGRTVRKFDTLLLPFLALLFLFNSLDKANIGNAETASFTADIGLAPSDLNTAVAVFYAFFVSLQPIGAALGRKYGMRIWVPSCMTLWGLCTVLHVWVRHRWQLILLRSAIGILEAGFYPTTVSYLSHFYTRFEFARRLSMFYGQAAVAGALGGVLSYYVFSVFPGAESDTTTDAQSAGWRGWQILFLFEGAATMIIAALGFLWLPQDASTAWFLQPDERQWAAARMHRDLAEAENHVELSGRSHSQLDAAPEGGSDLPMLDAEEEETYGLLGDAPSEPLQKDRLSTTTSNLPPAPSSKGLSSIDIISAVTDWKLWGLLTVNILSAIPSTAFTVFLPLVVQPLTKNPAIANLLSVPPFLLGAVVLYVFSAWSDSTRQRLRPIMYGLAILFIGLTGTVVVSDKLPAVRYFFLCVLLSGTFIASPLTVSWLVSNIPSAGKRSVALGINGWGNLAGIASSLLFQPKYAPDYTVPFTVTSICVGCAAMGYTTFRFIIQRENQRRKKLVAGWSRHDVDAERRFGRGPLNDKRKADTWILTAMKLLGFNSLHAKLARLKPIREGRSGEDRMTFLYSL